MSGENSITPIAPESVFAGFTSDWSERRLNAVEDPTASALDLTPYQRAKAVKATKAVLRRIKLRLYLNLLLFSVAKLALKCRHMGLTACREGLRQLLHLFHDKHRSPPVRGNENTSLPQ
jgi:hypothetical protein